MKIYIVTSGECSDYSIDSVFTDREQAEKYILMRHSGKSKHDTISLEIYETYDDKIIGDKIETKEKVYYLYEFCADKEFNIINDYNIFAEIKTEKPISFVCISETGFCYYYRIKVYLKDTDDEKAKKIAYDLLAKKKAEVQGL